MLHQTSAEAQLAVREMPPCLSVGAKGKPAVSTSVTNAPIFLSLLPDTPLTITLPVRSNCCGARHEGGLHSLLLSFKYGRSVTVQATAIVTSADTWMLTAFTVRWNRTRYKRHQPIKGNAHDQQSPVCAGMNPGRSRPRAASSLTLPGRHMQRKI